MDGRENHSGRKDTVPVVLRTVLYQVQSLTALVQYCSYGTVQYNDVRSRSFDPIGRGGREMFSPVSNQVNMPSEQHWILQHHYQTSILHRRTLGRTYNIEPPTLSGCIQSL